MATSVNTALLNANKALLLVQESIILVKLALNNAPSSDDKIALDELLTDLETEEDRLEAKRDQIENGTLTIPPPDPALMAQVGELTKKVEQAKIDGAAAGAALEVAGQALDMGSSI